MPPCMAARMRLAVYSKTSQAHEHEEVSIHMKPAGLRAVTLALVVLNLAGLLMRDATGFDPNLSLFWVILVMTVSYVVIWFFWRGRNWARWLVQLTSVLALLNLVLIPEVTVVVQAILLVEAALGAYLLYWLNTSSVRAFFRGPGAEGGA